LDFSLRATAERQWGSKKRSALLKIGSDCPLALNCFKRLLARMKGMQLLCQWVLLLTLPKLVLLNLFNQHLAPAEKFLLSNS
jgi:hypothetical protein